MSKFECEIFGLIHYGPDLSYYELYAEEERLLLGLQDVLQDMDAQHLDFWGTGDALQFQCVLPEFEVELVREFCDEAVALLEGSLNGRVLCLDKHLTEVHVFYLHPGRWQERKHDITRPRADDEKD